MPEKLHAFSSSRMLRILPSAVLLGSLMLSAPVLAQMNPGMQPPPPPAGVPPQGAPPMQSGPAVNPVCPRLEAQLATIDRGGSGDPARDDQLRRYQEAASQQQAELDRVTMQAKRMGCESSGFFSMFSGQSAQCGPVNARIQQMRGNLDQITGNLERLRAGGGMGAMDRDNQRRSVLTSLMQNNCGPQYANAAANPQGGNFLNNLFGGNNNNPGAPGADLGPPSGTYKTVCVRTCDGGYFPVSFATSPARFADDEKACKALCPATDAALYAYRNPGEDINSAVSVNGQPYTALPNAFKFRNEFNPACACRAQGQTWSDALKSIDEKAEAAQQGDIIVTEESAKKMQQQRLQQQKAAQGKKGAPPAQAAAPAEAAPPPADATASSENKPIRTVGPKFLQDKSGPSVPR
jgi:Protein of unknown function (DUF2865)